MKKFDIEFEIEGSGSNAGKKYGFMLAQEDGEKMWNVQRTLSPPPSMMKQQINLVVTAREDEFDASAARQLKRITEILAELEIIMEEDEVRLAGLDGVEYPVRLDSDNGLKESVFIHEKDREPEYVVSVFAWGLYE